jgi:hypothetical protein
MKIIARELAYHKPDLMRELVRWDTGFTRAADYYRLFYGKGNVICHLGTDQFVHNGIMSAVKKAESVSDSMLYAILTSNVLL